MIQRDELWNDINNLLQYLHSFQAVELVSEFYLKFDNEAPAQLLSIGMNKLQKQLEEAPKEYDRKNSTTK